MKNLLLQLFFFSIVIQNSLWSQTNFTRKDSLQGGLPIERTCFDVLHYDLNIKLDIAQKKNSRLQYYSIQNTREHDQNTIGFVSKYEY